MQNYFHQFQPHNQQKIYPETQTNRKTRSTHPQDNPNIPNPTIKQYAQFPSLSMLPCEPSPHSDIDSSRIVYKQAALSKPTQQRKSNWSRKQRIKYFVFLNYYSQVPYWGSDLKSIPTYKSLSIFVKTRSPQQCKSYHLSIRRNYKSIEEMLVSLREELKDQQGFARLVDKYEVEIISFQIEHKILESYGLQQKVYFQQKLVQRSNRTSNLHQVPTNPFQSVFSNQNNPNINSNRGTIRKHYKESDYPEQQCNLKINLKDFLNENNEIAGSSQQKPIASATKANINHVTNNLGSKMSPFVPSDQVGSQFPFPNMPNNMGYFIPPNMLSFPSVQNSKNLTHLHSQNMPKLNPNIGHSSNDPNKTLKPNSNSLSSTQQPNNSDRFQEVNPERVLLQQNYNRLIEANKNIYNPYNQNFNPFQHHPFMSPSNMPFASQFRNPMPFSIPPPGGIPYLLQGFHDPFNMNNPYNSLQANRFGPNLVPHNSYSFQKQESARQQELKKPCQETKQKQILQSRGQSQNQNILASGKLKYSQKRKLLLLQCHKHWVNWLRAVTELNKRKEPIEKHQNIPVNN